MLIRYLVAAALAATGLSLASPVVGSPVTSTDPKDQPRVLTTGEIAYRAGVKALAAGDLDAAEASFRESLKHDRQSPEPFLGLARVAIQRNDMAKAEVTLQLALGVAPTNPQVQFAYATLMADLDRTMDAQAAYEEAIRLAPEWAEPRVGLGRLLTYSVRDHADAVTVVDGALALAPDNFPAHLVRSNALTNLNRLDEARISLEAAVDLQPDNPVAWETLGGLASRQRDFDRAIAAYDKVLELNPASWSAHAGRGDALARSGAAEAAVAAYERAAEADPARAGAAQFRIGMLHEAAGDLDKAIAAYESAIKLDDSQAAAFNNLASILTNRGEHLDKARRWAETAVRLQPELAYFRDTLGWVLRATGDSVGALREVTIAAEGAPDVPEIQYHLGVLLQEAGDEDGARNALRAALGSGKAFTDAEDARKRLNDLGG